MGLGVNCLGPRHHVCDFFFNTLISVVCDSLFQLPRLCTWRLPTVSTASGSRTQGGP